MDKIYKKSVELNMKTDTYINVISNGLQNLSKGVNSYLSKDTEKFTQAYEAVCSLESEADALETDIKVSLYKFMLLPDVRADVLSLIKSLDDVIDITEEIMRDFRIQEPDFPIGLHQDMRDLVDHSIQSADALLLASKAFFNEAHLATVHINKIKYFEREADLIEDRIQCKIFKEDHVAFPVDRLQLTSFVSKIGGIADEAEKIGDKLTIFTIKREI